MDTFNNTSVFLIYLCTLQKKLRIFLILIEKGSYIDMKTKYTFVLVHPKPNTFVISVHIEFKPVAKQTLILDYDP